LIPVILSLSFTSCTGSQVDADAQMNESTETEEKMTDITMEETTEGTMGKENMSSYIDVTPEEAKKLIDENPGLTIIDVSPNYDNGHLPGAISYYIGDGSLEKAIPSLDPNGKYLVYCHVDSVAIAGAQALVDAGFKNVYRLAGNYAAWVDAGYPVEK
jgi:rhodanese-related sulfurtransferase